MITPANVITYMCGGSTDIVICRDERIALGGNEG